MRPFWTLVTVNRAAFRHTAEMVKLHDHGLCAGDSLYLAVTLELGATHMATLDSTLAANARRTGVKLIKF